MNLKRNAKIRDSPFIPIFFSKRILFVKGIWLVFATGVGMGEGVSQDTNAFRKCNGIYGWAQNQVRPITGQFSTKLPHFQWSLAKSSGNGWLLFKLRFSQLAPGQALPSGKHFLLQVLLVRLHVTAATSAPPSKKYPGKHTMSAVIPALAPKGEANILVPFSPYTGHPERGRKKR